MLHNNLVYQKLLRSIFYEGDTRVSRNLKYLEIPCCKVIFDMNTPFISIPECKVSLNFAVREAEWMLSGRNDIFHHNMARFSDDGETLSGAYGPRILSQLDYILTTLTNDSGSRQAVISIFSPNPRPSKDIPCTVGLQFRIHDDTLNTIVYMRSSDAWLGIPYDLFSFSMVSQRIRNALGIKSLGTLTFMLGSSHIYETDIDKARTIIDAEVIEEPRQVHRAASMLLKAYLEENTLEKIFS